MMNRRTLIAGFLGMLPVAVLGKSKKQIRMNCFTGRIKTVEGSFWYKNGKLHREDGPAKEYAD